MKATVTVKGMDRLQAELRNLAKKVPDTARKTMHRQADRVVKEAKLNAPVDEHNLEESIRKEVSYGGARRRLQIDITFGGMVNGVNVDVYALQVHENYDNNNPGKGTIAKREANPGRLVGAKFLTRAFDEKSKAALMRDMIETVNREWKL